MDAGLHATGHRDAASGRCRRAGCTRLPAWSACLALQHTPLKPCAAAVRGDLETIEKQLAALNFGEGTEGDD